MSENNNNVDENKKVEEVEQNMEGESLDNAIKEESSDEKYSVEDDILDSSFDDDDNDNDDDDGLYEGGSDKKDDSKHKFIPVLLIILGIVAIIMVMPMLSKGEKNPLMRVLKGYENLFSARSFTCQNETYLSIDPNDSDFLDTYAPGTNDENAQDYVNFASSIVPNLKIKTDMHVNYTSGNLVFAMNPSLIYKENRLLGVDMAFNPSEMSLNSAELFNRPIYGNLDKYFEDSIGVKSSEIDVPGYIDIILEKDEFISNFPKSDYLAALEEIFLVDGEDALVKNVGKEEVSYFGENLNLDKITMTYKLSDMDNLLQKWHDIAVTDETLKQAALAKYDKLAQFAIENMDYEKLGIELVDFLEETEETRKDIDENWQEKIDEIYEESVSSMNSQLMNEDTIFVNDFYMDGNNIKKVVSRTIVDGLGINSATSYTGYQADKVVFSSSDNSDSLEIFENDAYMVNLVSNLYYNVLKGESFKNMLDDIKNEAVKNLPEQEATKVAGMIDSTMSTIDFTAALYGVSKPVEPSLDNEDTKDDMSLEEEMEDALNMK